MTNCKLVKSVRIVFAKISNHKIGINHGVYNLTINHAGSRDFIGALHLKFELLFQYWLYDPLEKPIRVSASYASGVSNGANHEAGFHRSFGHVAASSSVDMNLPCRQFTRTASRAAPAA